MKTSTETHCVTVTVSADNKVVPTVHDAIIVLVNALAPHAGVLPHFYFFPYGDIYYDDDVCLGDEEDDDNDLHPATDKSAITVPGANSATTTLKSDYAATSSSYSSSLSKGRPGAVPTLGPFTSLKLPTTALDEHGLLTTPFHKLTMPRFWMGFEGNITALTAAQTYQQGVLVSFYVSSLAIVALGAWTAGKWQQLSQRARFWLSVALVALMAIVIAMGKMVIGNGVANGV